jgi:cell division protein FtsQ
VRKSHIQTDPRIRERRVAVARDAGRHRLRLIGLGAAVVALGASVLLLLHSSLLFSARHVSIVGSAGLARSVVLTAAGLAGDPPLIDVNPTKAVSNLEAIPTVGTASVTIKWPDSVEIKLTGRTPAVVIPLGTSPLGTGPLGTGPLGKGAATRYAVVDAAGRVLAIEDTAPAGLPVALAGSFAGQPGTYLRPAGVALVTVAHALGAGLGAEVRAVGYDKAGQIALSLTSGAVAIFGDASQVEQKLVSLATVLHDVDLGRIITIDLSSPSSPILTPIGAGRSVVLVAGG